MSKFKDEQKWSDTDRLTAWKLFVDSVVSDKNIYDKIARFLNRTEKSVRTELWKIYRINPRAEEPRSEYVYWNSAVRATLKYPDDMNGKSWTRRHDGIVMDASNSGLPVWRIAELLGRSEEEVVDRVRYLESDGRTAIFPELEYGNDRKTKGKTKSSEDSVRGRASSNSNST